MEEKKEIEFESVFNQVKVEEPKKVSIEVYDREEIKEQPKERIEVSIQRQAKEMLAEINKPMPTPFKPEIKKESIAMKVLNSFMKKKDVPVKKKRIKKIKIKKKKKQPYLNYLTWGICILIAFATMYSMVSDMKLSGARSDGMKEICDNSGKVVVESEGIKYCVWNQTKSGSQSPEINYVKVKIE